MECRLFSSLEKIFPDGRGTEAPAPRLTALRGESLSFQVGVKNEENTLYLWPEICSPLGSWISLRRVESVPVRVPVKGECSDENYLSLEPGLYPDVLVDAADGPVFFPAEQWWALWVEIDVPEDAPAGVQPFTLLLKADDGREMGRVETQIQVIPAVLPPQEIMHTEWFHADCLADYYQVPAFSPRHWEIIESFVRTAVRRGCNMLLTPHLTPALDTRVGGERTTVQLVEIWAEGEHYRFDFTRLKQWIDMALACGVKWLEMAHLFTQWGAKAAPKVMVWENGKETRRFGWDTPAVGGAYTAFLREYLPALTAQLRAWGVADRCYFHISDEPHGDQLESYRAAKQSVAPLLAGFPIMDALSDYAIFEQSGIHTPVVSIGALDAFLEKRVSPLWGYYCCGPTRVTTNCFIQMPLARTRALGLQLWKYQLAGFLRWGYNFYNTMHSVARINPYLDTEAGGSFPAGDSFLVYPGRDGKPEESLRLMALHEAFQDARALSLLESLIGRDKALQVLEAAAGEVTLTHYPWETQAMLATRAAINDAIAKAVGGDRAET